MEITQREPALARSGSRLKHTPFIGREPEFARLLDQLEAARRGDGRVVLLAGEPGIGKTRLLAEFATRARTDGWLVLSGSAYETEGMPPYLPFAEALRSYVRRIGDADLTNLITGVEVELSRILPELSVRLSESDVGNATSSAADRYQLFEHISDFLLRLASDSECGLLLCLDDLHWADRSTLLLLHHLARKLKRGPIAVAGTYRTEEVDPDRPFFSLLADLTRERLDERLILQPLSQEQAADLIKASGIGAEESAIQEIYRQTQGNPFYMEEVLRHLKTEQPGASKLESGRWDIPQGVREVIGRRLVRLKPEARRLLQAGAVLGDGFQFEVAVAMSELEENALMDALDQAITAGLLVEQGDICRFGHPLVQRTIYDSLTAARRRGLHLRAALAIEAKYGRHLEPYLSPLAVNYRQAGARADPDKAIDYSILAGASAAKALAYDEANAHWQAALHLMERYAFDPLRRADLLARLGDLMQVVGFDNYAESARNFKRAIELYEAAGAGEELASVQARLGLLLGAGGPINDNETALKYLHAAEEVLKDAPLSEAQLWLYSGLGLVDVWQVHPEEGLSASSKAMELGPQLGRQDRFVTNAIMCGFHLHAFGKLGEGFELMQRAWEKADEIDETYPAFVAASWLGGRLRELGDPKAAEAWFAKEVGQRRQDEAPSRLRALWSMIATARAMAGEMEGCRRILSENGVAPTPEIAFWFGDWKTATAAWTRGRRVATEAGNLATLAGASLSLAKLKSFQGDSAVALELLMEALAIGLEGPHAIIQMRASAELAILLVASGQIEEADLHLQRCLEILSSGEDWRGLAGRVALAEAVVALGTRDFGRAQQRFERALELFRLHCLPWDEAEAYLLWGGSLARTGRQHRQAARESFDKDLKVYEKLEAAPAWTDAVLDLRRELMDASKRPEAPGYPDALTEREVEVLRLVASGSSNREIADQLVISTRTVERHITHIYGKIGARGKADATSYALRHSLV